MAKQTRWPDLRLCFDAKSEPETVSLRITEAFNFSGRDALRCNSALRRVIEMRVRPFWSAKFCRLCAIIKEPRFTRAGKRSE